MAEISSYISIIESASRGEDVRDAIINALRAINTQGTGNSTSLDGHPASDFVKVEDMYNATYYDESPSTNGKKAVTSGGLYNVLGNISSALDAINGGS